MSTERNMGIYLEFVQFEDSLWPLFPGFPGFLPYAVTGDPTWRGTSHSAVIALNISIIFTGVGGIFFFCTGSHKLFCQFCLRPQSQREIFRESFAQGFP